MFNSWRTILPARNSAIALLLSLILAAGSPVGAQELKLPNLGESSTSMFSAEFEYQLGRAWLRIFRSQVPTVDDPLLHLSLIHI